MVEPHSRTAAVGIVAIINRADSDPIQLASYTVTLRLWSYPSDADDRIELPLTDRSHAIVIAKHARFRIGIAGVRPFVDQCSHLFVVGAQPTITAEWRPARCEAIPSVPLGRQCLTQILVRAKQREVLCRQPNELDCYDRSARLL